MLESHGAPHCNISKYGEYNCKPYVKVYGREIRQSGRPIVSQGGSGDFKGTPLCPNGSALDTNGNCSLVHRHQSFLFIKLLSSTDKYNN